MILVKIQGFLKRDKICYLLCIFVLGLNKNWYIYIDARPTTAPTTTTAPTAATAAELEWMKQEADALSADGPDGDGAEKMLAMVLLNLMNFFFKFV